MSVSVCIHIRVCILVLFWKSYDDWSVGKKECTSPIHDLITVTKYNYLHPTTTITIPIFSEHFWIIRISYLFIHLFYSIFIIISSYLINYRTFSYCYCCLLSLKKSKQYAIHFGKHIIVIIIIIVIVVIIIAAIVLHCLFSEIALIYCFISIYTHLSFIHWFHITRLDYCYHYHCSPHCHHRYRCHFLLFVSFVSLIFFFLISIFPSFASSCWLWYCSLGLFALAAAWFISLIIVQDHSSRSISFSVLIPLWF